MDIKKIDQRFSTTGQLTEADLETVAAEGYKFVINFRPDNEGGEAQPASAVLEQKAKALGLAYAYIPVIPNQIQAEHVNQLRSLLKQHSGQALGFCRTGNRANNVYQQIKPDCCS